MQYFVSMIRVAFINSALIAIIQLSVLAVAAQKTPCKLVHTGVFRLCDASTGCTMIRRTKDLQYEKNEELGAEAIFKVRWLDECTYELIPYKFIKGDSIILASKGRAVISKIKRVTDSTYITETTSNFKDLKLEYTVEIINARRTRDSISK